MKNMNKVLKRKLDATPVINEEKQKIELDEDEEESFFNVINEENDSENSEESDNEEIELSNEEQQDISGQEEEGLDETDEETEEASEIESEDENEKNDLEGEQEEDSGEEDEDDLEQGTSDEGLEQGTSDEDLEQGTSDEDLEEKEQNSDEDFEESAESEELSFESSTTDSDVDDNQENPEDSIQNIRKQKESKLNQKEKTTTKLQLPPHRDEYADHDTSDEEDIRNTVGNIPMNWYDEYKHLGYDWDGNKILKPESGDQLDDFLKRMEDPDFWRTVKDPQTGQNIILNDEDIEIIKRIKSGKIPDVSFDAYTPWNEWFTSEVMQTPLRKFPEHKRSFLPSKSDAKKVSKLVHALKMGWIKTRAEQEKLRAKKDPQFYMLWAMDDKAEDVRRIHKHIPAPKRFLPGHAESYNPPSEYLFDEKELKDWNKFKSAPSKRKLHFIPQKYGSLRKVPAYDRFIRERFLRCLDLYLCPRGIKMKLNIQPEDLVPKVQSREELQPFPSTLALVYRGHTDMIRTISVDKSGQYLVSGSDDGTVKLWEVNTTRCLKTFKTGGTTIHSVEWCPNQALSLILVASDQNVILINPQIGDSVVSWKTDDVLREIPQSDVIVPERISTTVQWTEPTEEEYHKQNYRIILKHFKEVQQCTWHGRGDYFATVMRDGLNRSVLINQLSKRRSQLPFTKAKGLIQCVLFHPTKPFLFVATQRHVRIYDLVKQTQVKKLFSTGKQISAMSIHPGGDNLLVASHEGKILWFDLDLSTKPYKEFVYHGVTSVRGLDFHKRYPLFASGATNQSLVVSHGMVYNDLTRNAYIQMVNKFRDHKPCDDYGIFDVKFHPYQPWVFTAGADGTVILYSN